MPASYRIPIIVVLHRLRNQVSKPAEVEDMMSLQAGYVYLAPANYHVLLEKDYTYLLDVSYLENYSRSSTVVTFTSAADAFGDRLTGILLSGVNNDGSVGLKYIAEMGATRLLRIPMKHKWTRDALNFYRYSNFNLPG